MKQKIFNLLSKSTRVYNLAVRLIANRIIRNGVKLTPQYLENRGFKYNEKEGMYCEPFMKKRDVVWVKFEERAYAATIRHSDKQIFITTISTIEHFEIYMLLLHSDNGIYGLAGI